MSRVRRHARIEMGEAINFEDVLTVMTVLLVLRLVFMVPLVNLDKAKTVASRGDAYWGREALWIHAHPGEEGQAEPYKAAFELEGHKTVLTSEGGSGAGGVVWLEAAAADSNVLVLRHEPSTGRFSSLRVDGSGHAQAFRHGTLLWSKSESAWFAASDSLDYGGRPESKTLERAFREWTRQRRGY
jgi:hypothetical protein